MADYRCPNCTGEWIRKAGADECPWCGQPLDGSYEYDPRVVSRVEADNSSENDGGLWFDTIREKLL